MQARGAAYFPLPRAGFWWIGLSECPTRHHETQNEQLVADSHCVAFALPDRSLSTADGATAGVARGC
jgi:hypothetical protein